MCRGVLSACGVVLPLLLLLPAGPAPSCCSWLCSCCRRLLHSCLGSCLCFPFGRPQSYESALRTAAHGLKIVSPFYRDFHSRSDEHFCQPFFFRPESQAVSMPVQLPDEATAQAIAELGSSLSAIFDEGKAPRNVRAALANLDVWAWRRKEQTKWQSAGVDQGATHPTSRSKVRQPPSDDPRRRAHCHEACLGRESCCTPATRTHVQVDDGEFLTEPLVEVTSQAEEAQQTAEVAQADVVQQGSKAVIQMRRTRVRSQMPAFALENNLRQVLPTKRGQPPGTSRAFRDRVDWILKDDVADLRTVAAEGKESVKLSWQVVLRYELEIRKEAM